MFLDIHDIPAAMDFRKVIKKKIKRAKLVIVLIGNGWLVADSTGQPRIMDKNDFVRIEIEEAIRASVPILPVLVNTKNMPDVASLPITLKDFPYISSEFLDNSFFEMHMRRILKISRTHIHPLPGTLRTYALLFLPRTKRGWLIRAFLIATLTLLYIGITQAIETNLSVDWLFCGGLAGISLILYMLARKEGIQRLAKQADEGH